MTKEIKTLKEWQQLGFYIFKTETLMLSQTYSEWLAQNPKGYVENK